MSIKCSTYKKNNKNSEASTKSYLRSINVIDKFLNISNLNEFRSEVTKLTDRAKKMGVDAGRLFSERQIYSKDKSFYQAVPNKMAFTAIDDLKPSMKRVSEQETNVSKAVLEQIASKLSEKLGVDYEIVNSDKAKELVNDPAYNGKDPFFHSDGKVYIVEGEFTLETPLHEFSHPFVRAIGTKNQKLFNNIMDEVMSTPQGEEIYKTVKELYPEDFEANGNPTNKALEEIAVRALTNAAKKNINPETGKVFYSAVKRLILQFKQLLREIFGDVRVANLNENTTLQELADMLTVGNFKIDRKSDKGRTYASYQTQKGMPFMKSTVEKMSKKEQKITVRTANHPSGIYTIDGQEYHVENVGFKYITDFKDPEALKRDFKGSDYQVGLWSHVDEFFDGANRLYVYQITKLDESNKNEPVSFKKSLSLSEKEDSYDPDNEFKNRSANIITAIKDSLKKQKAIFGKKTNSKQFVKDIEELEKMFDSSKDDVAAIFQYIEDSNKYINDLWDRFSKLKDKIALIEKSGRSLSAKDINSALSLTNKIKELASSYDILLDIQTEMYGDKSTPVSDEFQMLSRTIGRKNRLTAEYKDFGIDMVTNWLYAEAIDVNLKLEKEGKSKYALSKDVIRNELELASSDIGFLAASLDSAISSKDPITALAAKAIKFKMSEAETEDLETFHKLADEFEKSGIKNHDDFIEEVEVENRAKNEKGEVIKTVSKFKALISKFRTDLFEKAKNEFFESLGTKPSEGSEDLLKYQKSISKWFKENTSIRSDAKELIKRKKEELSTDDFNEWIKENTKVIDNKEYIGGYTKLDLIYESSPESVYSYNNKNIVILSGEFINPSKKYLNPKYEALKNNKYFNALSQAYNKANDQLNYSSRLKHGILPQVFKESIDKSLSERISKENIKEALDVSAHDTRYKVQTMSGEEYHGVPIHYVKKIDQNLVSTNLLESILKFSQMSNNFKHMSEIKANVDMLSDIVRERNVIETNSLGEQVKDAVTKSIRIKSKSEAKKVNERLLNFIDMAFYGNKELKSEVWGKDVGKIVGKLQLLTAISNMVGNLISAISNATWGNYQTFAQSLGGKNYTKGEWLAAEAHYTMNLPQYMADIGKIIGKSKDNQLMEMFDAIQGEFKNQYGEKVGGSIARRLFSTNALFVLNNATEHQIQMTSFIAMLKHRKVLDANGKEMSLYDAYEMKGNKLVLKDGVDFNQRDKFNFTNEIHAINKKLHGVYNDFDKGELQRQWFGKLVLMFRKHIYKGFVNRYGKEQLDVEQMDTVEGYYRTFSKKLYEDFKEFGITGAINWSSYTPEQKIAFNKTMLDVLMLSAAILTGAALGGDDDKKKKSWLQNMIILQSRRFEQDIKFYTVFTKDTWRMLKYPTATISTIESVGDLLGQLGSPTEKYKRKTGVFNKGDLKLKAKAYKALPIVRQIIHLMSPEDQVKAFNK